MPAHCLNVAIVGSGPAGYYAAERLSRAGEAVHVDIIDRLPTPFGLIRGGVAPDHQSIKQVARRYEKTALEDNVRFVGNITLGRDISIADLMKLYDAVILATGAGRDRALGMPGEGLPGVWGSASFVGWYNSHPDFAGLDIRLDVSAVAVIGNGNVALDVARVLAKTAAEMAGSDIADYAGQAIQGAPIRDIHIFGRRGPEHVSFTPKELGEMGRLERCVSLIEGADIPEPEGDAKLPPHLRKVLPILRDFAANSPDMKPVRIHFAFHAQPVEVLGSESVCGLRLERTRIVDGRAQGTGETVDIPCGLVIPCIGYRTSPIEGVPFDTARGCFNNDGGRVAPRLYVTGWARRGPSGTIGTNKPDGAEVADRLLAEVAPAGRPGRAGLDALLAARGVRIVTFRDWRRINAIEEAVAPGEKPRLKFSRVGDMLQVLDADGATGTTADKTQRGAS